MPLENYKELAVWQKARDLVKAVYQSTAAFPREELYGLTSQIRRAAVSIPANIAEGYARNSRKEYVQFVSISYGSASELETLIILAQDLGYLKFELYEGLMSDLKTVLRMLNKLRESLKNL
jgi:four helix bundle protein